MSLDGPRLARSVPGYVYRLLDRGCLKTPFACFLRSSARRNAGVGPASSELLPCPLPFPWNIPPHASGSRRQQKRFSERRACELFVNLQVVAINFLHLGMPRCCPPQGCRGVLSSEQEALVQGMLSRVRSCSRLSGETLLGCGSKLDSVNAELIRVESDFDSLRDVVYGVTKQDVRVSSEAANTLVVPTVASRVAVPDHLVDFDPLPFLDEPWRSAFERPDHLLKKEGVQGVPNPLTSSRNELWHLFWRWDAVKRLCLAVEGEWDSSKVCNLFCLSKPDGELRQIIDRRPRNLAETPPPADGPKMGHCSVFLGLVVPQKGCLRGSLDDLRNFYHAFKVSQERALSTVVGPTWCAKDFWNSQAVAALRKRRPDLNISPSTRVAACFAGLSMGDHYAPAIAQLSHEKVLEKFGALRAEEHLKLGCPLPRAPLGHYSGICIDDKVSLQIFPSYVPESASAQEAPGRDLEACAQADEAYIAVGLESHPKKKFRRASEFKAWGAHFEGNQGLVGMDRAKLVSLCAATAKLASLGCCTEQLLQKVAGLWAFAFQFRRPLFAIFQEIYRVGHPKGLADQKFRMPKSVCQELQLAAALGVAAVADLKANVCPQVYGTDASPSGVGIVTCHVGQDVARELFRRTDSRGFHTRLLSPISAYLHRTGIEPEEPSFLLKDDMRSKDIEGEPSAPAVPAVSLIFGNFEQISFTSCGRELFERFRANCPRVHDMTPSQFAVDFVEVYSGSARLSAAMLSAGFTVGPSIELKEGWDMSSQGLFNLLLKLVGAGRVGLLWLAPPCTTFSLALQPRLRSKEEPWGFDSLLPDVCEGSLHMHQCLLLWLVQATAGHEAVVETPWGGYARHLPWWKLCMRLGREFRVDQCRYEVPYLKPTSLLCSSQNFGALGRRCKCKVRHVRLEGPLTAAAAVYPLSLCQEVARLAAKLSKAEKMHQVTVAGDEQHFPPFERELRDHRGAQRFVSHLWSTHLAESLPWRVCRAYRFPRKNHINVLECHVHKTLMHLAPSNCRVVVFQDSMVTLGATAKGRSSSSALNRVLRQSLAVQLFKNLYSSGVHCPTWALRADDPSRQKSVRLPRVQLPSWLLALRAGRVTKAQDALDDASGTPRSWARWLLFGSAVLLASGGGYASVGAWAEACQSASRQKGSRARPCDRADGSAPRQALASLHGMGGDGRARHTALSGAHTGRPDPSRHDGRRVRTSALRAGLEQKELRRDAECPSAETCVCQTLLDRTVAFTDNVGESVARQSTPALPFAAAPSDGDDGSGVGMVSLRSAPTDRLLRLVEALRAHFLDCQRLHPEFRFWLRQRDVYQVAHGQVKDAWGKDAKRETRRALRRRFYQEVFQSHGPRREDLVLLHQPFP